MMKIFKTILAVSALIMLSGCTDRLTTEHTPVDTIKPWEQNPELWQSYKASLKDYKNREHYIVYARFANSPENAISEKGYMRCLPDSLDIVSLSNADRFSAFDKEDMEWMKSVGTKVLYRIDLTADADRFSSQTALQSYLDGAIKSVEENAMNGFALALSYSVSKETAVSAIEKLASSGKMLVIEGDPALIREQDREKISLYVLPTENIELQYNLHNAVQDAIDLGIPADKLILNVSLDGSFKDSSGKSRPAVEAFADNVVSQGPLKGLALCSIESDYYHFEGNWTLLRSTIQRLNPSR